MKVSLLMLVVGLLAGCQQVPRPPVRSFSPVSSTPSAMSAELLDRLAIEAVVIQMANRADSRDWAACEALFAPEVRVDYSSLSGSPAATVKAADLMAGWKQVLPGFQATQHMVTNVEVTLTGADAATCNSYVQAVHVLPNEFGAPVWNVVGRYRHELVRQNGQWKIAGLTFVLLHQTGNLQLPVLARERVAKG